MSVVVLDTDVSSQSLRGRLPSPLQAGTLTYYTYHLQQEKRRNHDSLYHPDTLTA